MSDSKIAVIIQALLKDKLTFLNGNLEISNAYLVVSRMTTTRVRSASVIDTLPEATVESLSYDQSQQLSSKGAPKYVSTISFEAYKDSSDAQNTAKMLGKHEIELVLTSDQFKGIEDALFDLALVQADGLTDLR